MTKGIMICCLLLFLRLAATMGCVAVHFAVQVVSAFLWFGRVGWMVGGNLGMYDEMCSLANGLHTHLLYLIYKKKTN